MVAWLLYTASTSVRFSGMRTYAVQHFGMQEAGVMVKMRHPNVVSFFGLCALPPAILMGAWRGRASVLPEAVAGGVVARLACWLGHVPAGGSFSGK